jgi:hypothetical protein
MKNRTLMWCGIGLTAAVALPLFIYALPHLF